MDIIKARTEDVGIIEEIYARAREFMKESGNPDQWKGGYPTRQLILSDVAEGSLYICREEGEPLAVFYFRQGEDPTYKRIFKGAWKSDTPYGVIHRVAVAARGRGLAGRIFDHCYSIAGHLRIDTHRDNLPMQSALAKNGFSYCGIIYLANGEERMAFERL